MAPGDGSSDDLIVTIAPQQELDDAAELLRQLNDVITDESTSNEETVVNGVSETNNLEVGDDYPNNLAQLMLEMQQLDIIDPHQAKTALDDMVYLVETHAMEPVVKRKIKALTNELRHHLRVIEVEFENWALKEALANVLDNDSLTKSIADSLTKSIADSLEKSIADSLEKSIADSLTKSITTSVDGKIMVDHGTQTDDLMQP